MKGGVAAELELSCSILSTRQGAKSRTQQNVEGRAEGMVTQPRPTRRLGMRTKRH